MKTLPLFSAAAGLPLAILFLMLLEGSCGSSSRAPVTLSYFRLGWSQPDELPSVESLSQRFIRETGIHLKNLPVPENTLDQLALSKKVLEGASGPDALGVDMVWSGVLADDLIDLRAALAKEILSVAPQLLLSYTVNGKLVAVPYAVQVGVLEYRADLLREYGYDHPPRTWDELESMSARIQAGERAKGKEEFWGYVWQGADAEALTCNALEWQAAGGGGQIIENDRTISVNNAAAIRAWERAKRWIGRISPPAVVAYRESDSINAFDSGRAVFNRVWGGTKITRSGMSVQLHWRSSLEQGKTGYTSMPSGSLGPAGTLGGSGLAVSRHSMHPQEAIQLVRFLIRNEIQASEREEHASGIQPEVYHRPSISETASQRQNGVVNRPASITGAKYEQVTRAYISAVHSVLTGDKSAPEAAADLEETRHNDGFSYRPAQGRIIAATTRPEVIRMKVLDVDYFKIGPRLTLTFAVLVGLILGGNGLLIWQFHIARVQTAHLALVSEQLIAILRFQDNLLSLRQRLDESAQNEDAGRLRVEADKLRAALLDQTWRTRSALAGIPSEARVDQAFLPTLEAIAIALPSQLDAITALASSGDWEAVHLRLLNELKPMETQTSALVKNMDAEVSDELTEAEAVMGRIQSRILVLVPLTAISTFFTAAFFGWTITRRMSGLRLEARVGERTRIARELHDTLLQSFHGLLFRFQAARNMLPKRPEEAIQALEGAIARAERAIAEGRDAVQDLRPDPSSPNDLEHLLTTVGQELSDSKNTNDDGAVPFRVTVEGEKQTLSPILQDEVYRMARELIRNAFRHAQARRIEAEIRYDNRLLRLRIRDDGKGIDPRVLKEGGRVGHWGLPGIRERAQQIGARLDFWSEAGAGTEVELTVPASIAYVNPRNRLGRGGRGFRIFPKKPKTYEHGP